MGMFDSISNFLKGLSKPEVKNLTEPATPIDECLLELDSTMGLTLKENFKIYDTMDAESPECNTALDFIADLCVQGDDVLMRGHKVIVDTPEEKDDKVANDEILNIKAYYDAKGKGAKGKEKAKRINEIIKKFEKRTKIKYLLRNMVRRALKYGDDFNQIIWGKDKKGNTVIAEFYNINAIQVEFNLDKYGRLVKETPFIPVAENGDKMPPLKKSEMFRIQFGSEPPNKRGVSLFWASRKTYNRLDSMESGMVIARILRSVIRYLFKVDVTGMMPEKGLEYLEKIKRRFTKKLVTDTTTGQSKYVKTPMAADEDIFFPVRQKSQDDVKVLENDPYLSNVDDVKHFYNKLLIGIKYPKAATGDASGSRNALAEQDTYPIRYVKSLQNMIRSSVEDLYILELRGNGVSEEDIEEINIEMPEIDAVSTVRKFNVEKTRADIIKVHKEAGVLPDKYLLENVMYLSGAEILKVEELMKSQKDAELKLAELKMKMGIEKNNNEIPNGKNSNVPNKTQSTSLRSTPKKAGTAGNTKGASQSMAAEGLESGAVVDGTEEGKEE